jgi:hypothetical protein
VAYKRDHQEARDNKRDVEVTVEDNQCRCHCTVQ